LTKLRELRIGLFEKNNITEAKTLLVGTLLGDMENLKKLNIVIG